MTDRDVRADWIRHVVPHAIRARRIRPRRARLLAALIRRRKNR